MFDLLELKVLLGRKPEAEAALAKLVKKGKKYGVVPLVWHWGEVFKEPHVVGHDDENKPIYRQIPFVRLFVKGQPPRVGGYEFIARVEFAEAGKLVQVVPGQSVPQQYWDADGHCDHCKKQRQRNDVFIVRDAAGGHLQVGRTCLQEFLGNDPKVVLAHFSWFKALGGFDRDPDGSYGNNFAADLLGLLSDAATAVRTLGWVSKAMARTAEEKGGWLRSTAGVCMLDFGSRDDRAEYKKLIEEKQTDADKKLAGEVLAWARALTDLNNEYLHNLHTVLSAEWVSDRRHVGLAVSAVSAYLRDKAREEELNIKRKSNAVSEHVGKVGQRLRNVRVKVELAIGLPDNGWGESTLFKFRDDAGNLYVWVTSGRVDLETNAHYLMTATVKEHREYKGTKETKVSRGVFDDVPATEEAKLL